MQQVLDLGSHSKKGSYNLDTINTKFSQNDNGDSDAQLFHPLGLPKSSFL